MLVAGKVFIAGHDDALSIREDHMFSRFMSSQSGVEMEITRRSADVHENYKGSTVVSRDSKDWKVSFKQCKTALNPHHSVLL